MQKFVSKQHLEKNVFDLPLFNSEETARFATHLIEKGARADLRKTAAEFAGELGVPADVLGDELMEFFGGVPGNTAEGVEAFLKSVPLTLHLQRTRERLERSITPLIAHNLLRNIGSTLEWYDLNDLGLCGNRGHLRGAILGIVADELICKAMCTEDAALDILKYLSESSRCTHTSCIAHNMITRRVANGNPFNASLVGMEDGQWVSMGSTTLPTSKAKSSLYSWEYDEEEGAVLLRSFPGKERCNWHLIRLPLAFPVVNVVLLHNAASRRTLYLVQLSASSTPFSRQATPQTCTDGVKERLGRLREAIAAHIAPTCEREYFVVHAPNCTKDGLAPPPGHTADFYFSPAGVAQAIPSAPAPGLKYLQSSREH